MILLYTVVLLVLSMITMVVKLRARALERKFAGVAREVEQLVRQPDLKPGNSNKADVCQSAKRAFQLGQLVARRDRMEGRHFTWQRWSDRFTGWLAALRAWKGKKLPYTLGALDVWLLLYLIDSHLGAGEYLSARTVIDQVAAWCTK